MKGYTNEQGKYVKGESKTLAHDTNSTYKKWHHETERKQFAAEIVQPRVHGKPNPEFIKTYGEIAREYFSQEEIDKAERQL